MISRHLRPVVLVLAATAVALATGADSSATSMSRVLRIKSKDAGPWFRVYRQGHWGFADRTGRMMLPARYDDAEDFFEGLAAVQSRAVAAVREHDRRLAAEHGADVLWVACTHGDVIKSVVADALGSHLDSFQRIVADPASMSVIRYTDARPFVLHVNHTGAQLASALTAAPPTGGASGGDAVVGGSTG